jgi:hypothetical protein
MSSTVRSYSSMRESTYRQKPSQRGSYSNRTSASWTTGKKAADTSSAVMTVETPHLAGIYMVGAASFFFTCALWSNVDEIRRAKILELIESEDLGD